MMSAQVRPGGTGQAAREKEPPDPRTALGCPAPPAEPARAHASLCSLISPAPVCRAQGLLGASRCRHRRRRRRTSRGRPPMPAPGAQSCTPAAQGAWGQCCRASLPHISVLSWPRPRTTPWLEQQAASARPRGHRGPGTPGFSPRAEPGVPAFGVWEGGRNRAAVCPHGKGPSEMPGR